MKTFNFLFILFSGLVQFSVFSQQNWEIKAPPVPTSNQLVSLYFVDAQTGWAAGEAGTILKTTDAGVTWRLIEIPWLSYLRDIYFPTSTVGYAVGENGFIIKSNDAGESWWLQPIRFTNNLQRVRFRNENVGWIIGEKGLILHTANGGATWEQQLSYCRQNLNGLALAGNDNVWVVGQDTTILMSSDEGQNWEPVYYHPETDSGDWVFHFKDCYFLDANQGWIGGVVDYASRSSEILISTTDGGISWSRMIIDSYDYLEYGGHASGGNRLNGGIQQIYFADPQNGYCLTGDLFTGLHNNRFLNLPFSTKDGGKNWRSKVLGRQEGGALAGRLAYLGPDRILTTGYRGDFRITTNQGATWGFADAARRNFQHLIIGNDGRLYGIHLLDQSQSTWSRSDDYGQTWVTFTPKFVNPTGALPPNLVLEDPGNFIDHHQTLYTCCGRAIFKSIDYGRTWQLVRTGMHADLYRPVFLSPDTLIQFELRQVEVAPKVYTPELTFIFSYDGGKSVTTNYFREIWNQIVPYEPGGPEKFISKHYFFDGRVGFLIGSEGNIIQTTNTGQSWRNISSGVVEDLWDLTFLNRQTGFVVGDFGRILKTTNGGETWRKTNSGTQEKVYAIGFKNATEGWAGTESGLLATVNGGESWQPVSLRYFHGPIREIEFDQAGNGYAYTYKLYPNETGRRPGGYMLLLILRNGSVSVANSATDLPRTLDLSQNYPNPFNHATHVEFYLPAAAPVTLQIFNLQGQLIRTLLDETRPAGEHRITWDGTTTAGHLAATGMYFYRINCQGETQTRKLLVVK